MLKILQEHFFWLLMYFKIKFRSMQSHSLYHEANLLKHIYLLSDLRGQQDKFNFNTVERKSTAKHGSCATHGLEFGPAVQDR
jgi:hypothetical protein